MFKRSPYHLMRRNCLAVNLSMIVIEILEKNVRFRMSSPILNIFFALLILFIVNYLYLINGPPYQVGPLPV